MIGMTWVFFWMCLSAYHGTRQCMKHMPLIMIMCMRNKDRNGLAKDGYQHDAPIYHSQTSGFEIQCPLFPSNLRQDLSCRYIHVYVQVHCLILIVCHQIDVEFNSFLNM